MKISDKLTKELISYMFSNFGIVSPPLFGKAGISEKIFKSNTVLEFQDDTGVNCTSPIYSAITNIGQGKMHVVFTAFNDNEIYEFAVVLQLDDFPIYGIKQVINSDDVGIFVVSSGDGNWRNPNMYDKLLACAGLEHLTDRGVGWVPEQDLGKLFTALQQLVEM